MWLLTTPRVLARHSSSTATFSTARTPLSLPPRHRARAERALRRRLAVVPARCAPLVDDPGLSPPTTALVRGRDRAVFDGQPRVGVRLRAGASSTWISICPKTPRHVQQGTTTAHWWVRVTFGLKDREMTRAWQRPYPQVSSRALPGGGACANLSLQYACCSRPAGEQRSVLVGFPPGF